MKGQKFLALLGGFAVATTCTTAFAADAGKAPAFSEAQAGQSSRGIALDELFATFKSKANAPTAKTNAVAAKTPTTAPTTHLTPTPSHKVVAAGAKKSAAPVRKTAASEPTRKAKPAIYSPSLDETQAILAVSSGGSDKPIITASLDKPGAVPKYKSGDRMVVKLHAHQDCNVLVFDYDSTGTLTQLFPNEFETNGSLKAGSEMELGGTDSKYTLDVAGRGLERIFVYAYPANEGPITVAMNPVAHTPFRSVEITPDQYRRLVKESRTYFEPNASHDRSVKVTPKSASQQVANASLENDKAANKLELTFQIEK